MTRPGISRAAAAEPESEGKWRVKCPQCGNEMVRYQIRSSHWLWCRPEENPTAFERLLGGTKIGLGWFLAGYYVRTHRCAACGVQVLVERENEYQRD